MLQHTLRQWRGRHFWALLLLSLVVLFCVYRITLPSPIFINVGGEGDERYLRNFHSEEQSGVYPFRWTKGSSYVQVPDLGFLPLEITVGADAARSEGQPLPRVALIGNGVVLADFTMQNGIQTHRLLYHPPLFPLPKDLLLEIKSDTFASPGDEYRALGVLVNTVEIKPILSPRHVLEVSLMGALSIAFSYLLLRWLGVSRKRSLVCGIVVLALLGLDMVGPFMIVRFLAVFFGLLVAGYGLVILLEAMGYRELLITHLGLAGKTLEMWARDHVSAIGDSIKAQALSPRSQGSGIVSVLPAYLPAVVLFILMPFALYLPNQSTFDNNLGLVLPYLVLAVVYLVLLVALLFFVGQPWRAIIVILLFYVGLYLCLSDILSPVQLGELMGGRETPEEPFFLTVVEVVLAVAVMFGVIKLPWERVRGFGSIFVVLLLASEVIVVLTGLSPEASLHYHRVEDTSDPPEKLAGGGNIYHITFDGYSGASLLGSLETMGLGEGFDGFTFFKHNRANYGYTTVSVPSYMTGSFYEENSSLEEWTERHKSSGVISNVYEAGYEVSMYGRNTSWSHEKASHVKVNGDVLREYESLSPYCHFVDLWLLRVVPNCLQQEVYREGKGVFTRWLLDDVLAATNTRVLASVELMRQLIDDEADRPDHGQYVYAHLMIPHPPYVVDRNCVFSSDDTGYDEQALCATRLMAELISKLKELGRYDEATIIIQADHATTEKPCSEDASDRGMSSEIEKEIEAVNVWECSAKSIDNQTCALLLIKPSLQSGKPLVISDRPTQLLDIPATLYDLLDLPVRAREGESVFSPDFPETREIHMFFGLWYQKDEQGKEYRFGQNLFKGEANHFSFTNGKGWKVYPNIHARWE
jgi:hypothetical protein